MNFSNSWCSKKGLLLADVPVVGADKPKNPKAGVVCSNAQHTCRVYYIFLHSPLHICFWSAVLTSIPFILKTNDFMSHASRFDRIPISLQLP